MEPDAAGQEPVPDEFFTFSENVRYLSVQTGDAKMVRNEQFPFDYEPRFFDLTADVGEYEPNEWLSEADQEALAERAKRYTQEMPDLREQLAIQRQRVASPDQVKRLVELGYMTAAEGEAELARIASGEPVEEVDDQVLGPNEMLEEEILAIPLEEFWAGKDDDS